jgi:hypothetical protein
MIYFFSNKCQINLIIISTSYSVYLHIRILIFLIRFSIGFYHFTNMRYECSLFENVVMK